MVMLAEAFIRLRPDARTFPAEMDKGVSKAARSSGDKAGKEFTEGAKAPLSGLGKFITGIFASALVVKGGQAVVGYLKDATKAASDLGETQSKTKQVFGAASGVIEKFASTSAKSLGQSRQAAMDAAATFGVFGRGAGQTGTQLGLFATKLVTLSTDMASFSNTSPDEAVTALGAALRGERDPIEKYGILLNDANVKARAMSLGIVKASGSVAQIRGAQAGAMAAQKRYSDAVKEHGKNSFEANQASAKLGLAQERLTKATKGTIPELTAQQKVLATKAEIEAQSTLIMGDFQRTSAGLANQQRILGAQWQDMKATIGQALLPVVTSFVTVLTSRVMPALMELWQTHGPAVTAWLKGVSDRFSAWAASLSASDWQSLLNRGKDALKDMAPLMENIKNAATNLGPALKEAGDSGSGFADSISVATTVTGFLADHADLLAKALPYLAAGYVAVKVAQSLSNVVAVASVPLRIAELAVNRKLVQSQNQLTASVTAQTVVSRGAAASTAVATAATAAGDVVQKRSVVSLIAHKVATVATAAATKVAAAGQWLLNAAMSANPIGLVVLAVVALIAIIVIAYKKNETFRNIVQGAWKGIQIAIGAVANWFTGTIWPSLKKAYDQLSTAVTWWWKNIVTPAWHGVQAVIGVAWKGIQIWFAAFKAYVSVLATAITWFWKNVMSPAWQGIAIIVKAGWAVVKFVFDLFMTGMRGVGVVVTWLWRNIVAPAWAGMQTVIRTGWTIISGIFDALKRGVKAAGDGFKTGVNIARTAWEKLQDAARKPVAFVINSVLAPLSRRFNDIAAKIPGLDVRLPVPSFLKGGQVPGQVTAGGDDMLAAIKRGEYLMPVDKTRAFLPVLEAMRNGKIPSFLNGGRAGGPLDALTGPAGIVLGKLDPVEWFKSKTGLGDLAQKFGGQGLGSMVGGAAKTIRDGAIDALKNAVKSMFDVNSAGSGPKANLGGPLGSSVASILAFARTFNPQAQVSSGYRRGANDYHGRGLAADLIGGGATGMRRIAAGFYAMSGRLLELIHTPGSYFVKNGRRVGASYYASVLAGHYNHVHVAANRLFDKGGRLAPGWNSVYNGTGANEDLVPAGTGGFVMSSGAFQLIVQGNLTADVLPEVERMFNQGIDELWRDITRGRRR